MSRCLIALSLLGVVGFTAACAKKEPVYVAPPVAAEPVYNKY